MNWPLAVAATGVSATAAQVIIVAAVLWRTRGSNQRHDLTDTCRHCQAITTQTVTTDEASAMERLGHHPRLIEGARDNIKITFPDDLALAEALLAEQIRTGVWA